VLTHCRSLVLLHTLSPSSLAAISSPQTPSKVFATLTIFFIGGLPLLIVFAQGCFTCVFAQIITPTIGLSSINKQLFKVILDIIFPSDEIDFYMTDMKIRFQ
jgi:hypothetical protein